MLTMLSPSFITAGNAIFTIEVPQEWATQNDSKPHYTFKVRRKEFEQGKPIWFVNLLTGPDNTSDYTYVGLLNGNQCRVTRNSKVTQDSLVIRLLNRTLQVVFSGEYDRFHAAGFQIHHEGRCGRCGRKLTVPESIKTGIGPECAGRMK